MAEDFEDKEDPLKDPKPLKIIEDEEDDAGGGVDYRRMFKGKEMKKFQSIPKRGEKDFEPDGTNKQQYLLQEGREAMYAALSFEAGLKHRASTGVWIDEYSMSHIPQKLCTGPWFQNTGIGGPSGQWLLPEETLLMVSSGRMELLDEDGFEMGVLGAWGACIEPAGGVNKYLIYSQLRRAGYNVFQEGYLTKDTLALNKDVSKIPLWRKLFRILVFMTAFLSTFYSFTTSILRYLASWLIPRSHNPYDSIYATLPSIPTFTSTSFSLSTDALSIAFEVWRPSPTWKRKSPGPPDFHICVLDGHDPFPSLERLEMLYNSVARKHPLGVKGGKVVIAVVDSGVSNYLTLDDGLFDG